MVPKITAIIPSFNEASNITEAIRSVLWADEVLVVDSYSTDDTISLAKKEGASVIQREYENSASQKNWAIPQAKHPWIFLLDADERCSKELRDEIQQGVSSGSFEKNAYWIYRTNYFMGKHVRFSGWQGDKVIRLFRRDHCKYEEKHVHAEVVTSGQVGFLKSKITHNTYQSMDHFEEKMKRYASWSALDYESKTGRIGFFHLQMKPAFRFIRHYILKGGLFDGKVGFQISKMMALGVRWRYEIIKAKRKGSNGT